jgi:hypothetical protein
VHDGCISVEAAFTCQELGTLGLTMYPLWATTRRHFPWFRLSLVVRGQQLDIDRDKSPYPAVLKA